MKFIELFGMPGSGKSYLVKLLKKNREKFPKKIIFIYFRSKSFLNFVKKFSLILLVFPFNLFSISFYRILNFFINIYKPINSKIFSIRTLSIFFNSIYLLSVARIFKILGKNQVVLDQGFFQLFWSILYEMDYEEKSYKFLIKKWHDIINPLDLEHIIYKCSLSYEVIFERIINRNGDSIIEDKIRNKQFLEYEKIFEFIIEKFIRNSQYKKNYCLKYIDTENTDMDNIIKFIEE